MNNTETLMVHGLQERIRELEAKWHDTKKRVEFLERNLELARKVDDDHVDAGKSLLAWIERAAKAMQRIVDIEDGGKNYIAPLCGILRDKP